MAISSSGSQFPVACQIVVGVRALGAGVLGMTSGSVTNPTAGLVYVDFASTLPSNKTIVHEFGHGIGFHEENSSTSPSTQRSSGATSLEGEGDMGLSVMTQSACNTSSALSAWDVMGGRQLYGMKAPGSIAGPGGLVANIHGGTTAFGLPITGWPSVSGAWNEHFVRSSSSSLLLTATSGSTTRCLNIQGGVISSGWTPLVSWDCNEAYTNSQFHFTAVAWRAMGNRCVQAASSASGAKLSLQACGSSSLQKWDFVEGNSRIRLNGTNLCATVPSGSTALGTQITLTTCGNSYQTFSYSNGHINYSNVCLNVLGGTTANGNAIGLWNGCTASPTYVNEQFTIRGPITGMGQCVDMQNGVPYDGVPIGVYPCNGTAAQTWEYFW